MYFKKIDKRQRAMKKKTEETLLRIRASLAYSRWVQRNKQDKCYCCASEDNLECHHVVQLYHSLLGAYKIFGDWGEAGQYVVQMHDEDNVGPAITLCQECHRRAHPWLGSLLFKQKVSTNKEAAKFWTFFHRNYNFKFAQSTSRRKEGEIGLLTLQILLGLNWYILNGYMDSRILKINPRNFAKILGKDYGTSFLRSFYRGLSELQKMDMLAGYTTNNSKLCEIYVSEDYLKQSMENPWFMPLDDIQTHKMSVLSLRMVLRCHNGKKSVVFALQRIQTLLNIQSTQSVLKMLPVASKAVPVASFRVTKEFVMFKLKKNKSKVPIHSLRHFLSDALTQ